MFDDQAVTEPAAKIAYPGHPIILHIGPHKTGTTAIQNALYHSAQKLQNLGIDYLVSGNRANANYAARAIRGKPTQKLESTSPLPLTLWTELAKRANANPDRTVIISGEGFCDLDDAQVFQVVNDLDTARLQVVVTVRPIAKIVTSQWQQYVQNDMKRGSLDEFLQETLKGYYDNSTKGFWRRHRHDHLVRRWCTAVGRERVSVIVVDDQRPSAIYSSFEDLMGVGRGTLTVGGGLVNRSLSLPEAELVRAYYMLLREQGFHTRVYMRGKSIRPALYLKEHRKPSADEPRIAIPAWARGDFKMISASLVAGIEDTGARIVGDLSTLARAEEATSTSETKVTVSPELGAFLAAGMVIQSGIAKSMAIKRSSRLWNIFRQIEAQLVTRSAIGARLVYFMKDRLRNKI